MLTEPRDGPGPSPRDTPAYAVRCLVDTGATESYISESFINDIGANIRLELEKLAMANGSVAVSKATVTLPISLQDYWDESVLKLLPMNNNFDVISIGVMQSTVIYCTLLV